MAPQQRAVLEGPRASLQRLGDAFAEHHRAFASAADHHRHRAVRFLEGVASALDQSRAKPAPRQLTAGEIVVGVPQGNPGSRRRRGQGVRLVSSASAAEATVPATVASAAGTTVPATVASVVETTVPATVAPATSAPAPKLQPTAVQLLAHPVALLHYVPKDAALFVAGAVSGATAKTLTAPLDRWKLMLQVKSVQNPQAVQAVGNVNLFESFVQIGKEEGVLGYWKGNLPQVLRIIPYSAVQLFAYETYKKLFMGKKKDLTVAARLAAGACAGMTSTFITYPLDVLRLRLAVEPGSRQMTAVAMKILREEGAGAFYKGLGPSLISIAPYIALNFCAFDLVKKSIPEKYRKTPQASLFTALCATSFATVMCYPLDTVRRQMQMRNTPFKSISDAFPGIVKRDGIQGLYRGFIANALKNLPNSSIRLTTYDTAKNLIASSNAEFDRLVEERTRQEGGAAVPSQGQPLPS